MKKKKWIMGTAIGLGLTCCCVLAADGLVNIAVNYDTVKKIVVNHEEQTPPEGEEAFEYNGRTYVPLRFIGEALGKNVSWNGGEGIVNITDIPEGKVVFEDDLSGKEKNGNYGMIGIPVEALPIRMERCSVILIIR